MRHLNRFAVLLVLFVVGCGDSGKQNADAEIVAPGPLTAEQARQALSELLDAPEGKRVEYHDLLVRLRPALDDPKRFEYSDGWGNANAWNVSLRKRSFHPMVWRKHFRVDWRGEFRPRADGTWEAKVVAVEYVERTSRDDD